MVFVGDGSWRAVGREFLRYFIMYGKLVPDHRVLDVGCGIGRMAAALSRYVSPRGTYEGFDVVQKGIAWCQETIHSRHPNFFFTWADIENQH